MVLNRNTLWRLAATTLAAAAMGHAAAQTSQAETHRDAATRNVGSDTFMMQNARAFYCNLTDDNNAIVIAARATNSIRVPLTQVFDDVWIIGSRYVAQYLIKTADGFVMVDSGNNATEVQTYDYNGDDIADFVSTTTLTRGERMASRRCRQSPRTSL